MAEYKLSFTAEEINQKLSQIGSGGGAAVNWEDIQNKPFGLEGQEEVVLIEPTTLPFQADPDTSTTIFYAGATPEMIELWNSDWIKCTITFNGVEYVCDTAVELMGIKVVGNYEVMLGTGNNGMPFVAGIGDYQGLTDSVIMYNLLATDSATVGASITTQGIKTLESKFIGDIPWDKITNKPFFDIPAGTTVFDEQIAVNEDLNPITSPTPSLLKSGFIVGKTYDVTINGNTYQGIGNKLGSYSGVMVEGASDIAFALIPDYMGMSLALFGEDFSDLFGTTVSIKIAIAEDATKTIDSKYLPENLGSNNNNSSQVAGLPEVSIEDNDKVLKVVDGSWAAAEAPSGLPEVTISDAGKFLRVSENGSWNVELIANAEEVGF